MTESIICSIAGSSATIYAYLGEFHCSQNRSKAIMAASFVYGVACNFMPVLGFLLLNRNFSVDIPLLDIEFKPWRLYLLACGLPSFICAIILLYFPESPKFTFSKVSDSQTLVESTNFHYFTGQRRRNIEDLEGNLQNQQSIFRILLRRDKDR